MALSISRRSRIPMEVLVDTDMHIPYDGCVSRKIGAKRLRPMCAVAVRTASGCDDGGRVEAPGVAGSDLGCPAVGEQLDAVDVAGGVTGEESDSAADLFRLADAADGALAAEVFDGGIGVCRRRKHVA